MKAVGAKRTSWIFIGIFLLLSLVLLTPQPSQAQDVNWTGDAGDHSWKNGSNWDTTKEPQENQNVNINKPDSVYYDTSNNFTLGDLNIDEATSPYVNVYQNQGALTAANTSIGIDGRGYYHQTGGTNTVNYDLTLGVNSGSFGYYELGGDLNVTGNSIIGQGGEGQFLQSGGTHTIGTTLTLGSGTDSIGSYNLDNGTLIVKGDEYVGSKGIGTFNQGLNGYGGSHQVQGNLYIDPILISSSYNLYNGTLEVWKNVNIGNTSDGTGAFIQSGGSHTIGTLDINGKLVPGTGELTLGKEESSTGYYSLLYGTDQDGNPTNPSLTVYGNTIVGNYGAGIFSQSGGTHTIGTLDNNGKLLTGTGDLILGKEQYSKGYYYLSGTGVLNAGHVVIGSSGTGTFIQTGGTHNVTANDYGVFVLGDSITGIGTYTLKDGRLTTVNGFEEYIGNSGKGYFNQSGGTHDASNSAVYLGVSEGGYGEYNMSGGTFKAGGLSIGEWGGTGKFYHSGGSVTVNSLQLARQNFSNGYYELSGTGQLTVNGNVDVGVRGDGYFKQTGGTNQVNGTLTISVNPGTSTGKYEMSGGTLNVANIINNGSFINSGGTVGGIGGTPLNLTNYGTMSGTGTITGNVINYGIVSPGSSPGTLTISGDYKQDALGTLLIEIAGTTQGSDYDFLNISGQATLDGKLQVNLLGFDPAIGNSFEILYAGGGVFNKFNILDLPSLTGRLWEVNYGTYDVTLEVNAVPVPSTLLLMGTGLIGLAGLMRRKFKR